MKSHLFEAQKSMKGLLCFLLFVSSLSIFAQSPQASSQLVSCETMWSGKNSQYDYSSDASQTELGNEGYQKFAKRLNRSQCKKPWTILVYMQADNNLSPYALMDLYEMEAGFQSPGQPKVGSTLKSDLLVQVDTNRSEQVRRLHMFQTPEPYHSKISMNDFQNRSEKDIRSPIVMSFDERARSLSAGQELEEFLRWGIAQYPAERYMVIVWGHGQGWTSRKAVGPDKVTSQILSPDEVPEPLAESSTNESLPQDFQERGFGGLAFDESNGSYLSIPELSRVLALVSRKSLGGRPIDVYASDACLMQMVEVAFEMSPFTRYIVGSTQVQNFLGLPYRRMLTELNTGYFGEKTKAPAGSDEAFLMAKMIPKVFKSSMQPQGLQGRLDKQGIQNITMSSINSLELKNSLAPQMVALSQALMEYMNEDLARVVDLQFVIQSTPSFLGGAQDLGAFLTLMSNLISAELLDKKELTLKAQKLRIQVESTQKALSQTVTAFVLGRQYSNREEQLYLLGIRGVSVWLPSTQDDYRSRIGDFRKSAFAKQRQGSSSWLKFVDLIYK